MVTPRKNTRKSRTTIVQCKLTNGNILRRNTKNIRKVYTLTAHDPPLSAIVRPLIGVGPTHETPPRDAQDSSSDDETIAYKETDQENTDSKPDYDDENAKQK